MTSSAERDDDNRRAAISAFLADYRLERGIADELLNEHGKVRPVWQNLIATLATMPEDERANRKARADIYLRDSGIFYRQYDQGDTGERDWPLSHVPVLLAEDEWQHICAGLIERADLLEHIVQDIYGENALVANGHLPASLIAQNPQWLRPMMGVQPKNGHFLQFIGFDVGRGPKGKWWVLGDRTQAPAGIGFSLENRIATRRAFPELYDQSNVLRLAGFFSAFRDMLESLKTNPDGLVAIMTPGQFNESYFEHAYIARYLGLVLVEGEDLVVRQGKVMVRTIKGLQPVDVLWRRLEAKWVDPLHLDPSSFLGTSGMVSAVRDQGVAMVNMLGSGILETRALQAFIPKIARIISGKPLTLPNIATWWCGQQAERNYVKAHANSMIIGDAFSSKPTFDPEAEAVIGGIAPQRDFGSVEEWIDANGSHLVGQEAVTLSTTPAFDGDRLVERPMSLRIYLARTEQGWQVMPGGFARIGQSGDATKLALQKGGSVADVWIVSDRPVADQSLIKVAPQARDIQSDFALPSKAADNLFWLGRYVERAENAFRMLRAYHYRLAESGHSETNLLKAVSAFLDATGMKIDAPLPAGAMAAVGAAQSSASHVRDRFSTDGWLALNDLHKTASRFTKKLTTGDNAAHGMSVLLRKISGFSGLVHENMYHFVGWRFLTIGQSLERATFISGMLAAFANEDAQDASLELALEVGDSTIAHRRRFGAGIGPDSVADILGFDGLNPRSIQNQLNDIVHQVSFLPGSDAHHLSDLQRMALEQQSALQILPHGQLSAAQALAVQRGLFDLSAGITDAYLR